MGEDKNCGCLFRLFVLFLFAAAIIIPGCGSGGSDDSPPVATEWVKIDSIATTASVATMSGTAWISQSWAAWHCSGIACFFDTSTDNYPGVTVTCTNQTTGTTVTTTSFYGGGTNWVHQWRANVPLVSGKNVIVIAAFDPESKGGSLTLEISL
jgi:hypothetical protein